MSDKNTPPQVPNLTTPVPQRSDMENFDVRADVLLTELPVTIEMFNTAIVWLDENFLTLESIEAVRDEVADLRDQTQGIADTFDTDIAEQIDIAKDYAIASQTAADIALTTVGMEATGGEDVKRMFNPTGSYKDFGAPLPPNETWLPCDGSSYLIDEYPNLFESIAHTYSGPDNLKELPKPPALPLVAPVRMAFSPNSEYLLVLDEQAPGLRGYKVGYGEFVPLALPSEAAPTPTSPTSSRFIFDRDLYLVGDNVVVVKDKAYRYGDPSGGIEFVKNLNPVPVSHVGAFTLPNGNVGYISKSGTNPIAHELDKDTLVEVSSKELTNEKGWSGTVYLLRDDSTVWAIRADSGHFNWYIYHSPEGILGDRTTIHEADYYNYDAGKVPEETLKDLVQTGISGLLLDPINTKVSGIPSAYLSTPLQPTQPVPVSSRTSIPFGHRLSSVAAMGTSSLLVMTFSPLANYSSEESVVLVFRYIQGGDGYPPSLTELREDALAEDTILKGVVSSTLSDDRLLIGSSNHPYFTLLYDEPEARKEFRVPKTNTEKPIYCSGQVFPDS